MGLGSDVFQVLHPRWNVALALQHTPDIDVVRALCAADEVGIARQRPGAGAGPAVEFMRVARGASCGMAPDVHVGLLQGVDEAQPSCLGVFGHVVHECVLDVLFGLLARDGGLGPHDRLIVMPATLDAPRTRWRKPSKSVSFTGAKGPTMRPPGVRLDHTGHQPPPSHGQSLHAELQHGGTGTVGQPTRPTIGPFSWPATLPPTDSLPDLMSNNHFDECFRITRDRRPVHRLYRAAFKQTFQTFPLIKRHRFSDLSISISILNDHNPTVVVIAELRLQTKVTSFLIDSPNFPCNFRRDRQIIGSGVKTESRRKLIRIP